MDGWRRDLTRAARSLVSARSFTALVVCTLGLGLGANAAVFGALNALVLRPLPYLEPDRLVRVYQTSDAEDSYLSGPVLTALRDGSHTLDLAALYTYTTQGVDLSDRLEPERVVALPISANYFRALGVQPAAGTTFDRGDERPQSRVALISERIWRDHLGGAADAIGRMLPLSGVPHRVVGVIPDSFEDPLLPGVEVWTPVNLEPGPANSLNNNYLSAIARLRPGATLSQAQAELATISAGLQSQYRQGTGTRSARVTSLQADTVGSAGRVLWLLFAAVGLLLVIACVNVAGLILVRGAAREAEFAVRSALGGSRWRLTRELLCESLLLSFAGGIAGLAVGRIVTALLLAAAPDILARAGHTLSDPRVFAFGFALALLSGLAVSIAPALQFARPDLEGILRESRRGSSASRRQVRLRNALVVGQTAMALVLLIGAGLLLRTFERLTSVNVGFRPDRVMTFEVHLPEGRYADPERRADFHLELQRRVSALRGVTAAAAVSRLPLTGTYHNWGVRREDQPDARNRMAQQRVVEGDFFRALGIPVLRGHTFVSADRARKPRQVVVNAELVRRMFGEDEPIGRQLRINDEVLEVIGVVGDVPLTVRTAPLPTIYHSHQQFASDRNWGLVQLVSLEGTAPSLLNEVRRELASIDPGLVLYEPRLLTEVVGAGISQERFALLVIGSYALLALSLSALGLYGVLSYSVNRRQREMSVRLALGAERRTVMALVLGDGVRLIGLGVILGGAVAVAATRALSPLLFEVSPTEPLVFAIAGAAIAVVSLAASWFPARTATRVDPIEALRSDT